MANPCRRSPNAVTGAPVSIRPSGPFRVWRQTSAGGQVFLGEFPDREMANAAIGADMARVLPVLGTATYRLAPMGR